MCLGACFLSVVEEVDCFGVVFLYRKVTSLSWVEGFVVGLVVEVEVANFKLAVGCVMGLILRCSNGRKISGDV